MAGDYARQYSIYGGSLVDVDLPTVNPFLILAKSPSRIIAIQRIVFTPKTYVLGTLQFFDSVTSAVIGSLYVPDRPNIGTADTGILRLDFGPIGTKLTAGAHLLLGVDNAAGRLHIDAYQAGPLPGVPKYVAPSTAGVT